MNIKLGISLCILVITNITGKTLEKISLIPFTQKYDAATFFDTKDESPFFVCRPIFDQVQKKLNTIGYNLSIDHDIHVLDDSTIICSFDIHHTHYKINGKNIEALSRYPQKKILFLWEAEVVLHWNFSRALHSYFDKVYTWKDEIIDGAKYHKFYWPQPLLHMIDDVKHFDDKNFCVLIAGCKKSSHPQELYTERKKIIEFFNSHPDADFHFFGGGSNTQWQWDTTQYPHYKGPVPELFTAQDIYSYPITPGHLNKLMCLKEYKFCICYENSTENGWITEKIFDCFISGCVPVYLGASNISDLIPKECFIDRRNFKNDQELYSFLKSLSQQEYQEYITAIKNYLASDQVLLFSKEYFLYTYIKALELHNYYPLLFNQEEQSIILKAKKWDRYIFPESQ